MTKITVLKRRAFLKVLISEIGKSSAGEGAKKTLRSFLGPNDTRIVLAVWTMLGILQTVLHIAGKM